MQGKAPLNSLNAYLDGFHFYSGNRSARWRRITTAVGVNEDIIQCVIFDGNDRDAKIMGVEYIVSARLVRSVPAEEKNLWHSHVHEVKCGPVRRAWHSQRCRARVDGEDDRHVREDMAHLAYRSEALLPPVTDAHDGLCRWASS